MQKTLGKLLKQLEELNNRVLAIEQKLSTQKTTEDLVPTAEIREESFREFFIKYGPQKETDKTLVIIYYLESQKKLTHITTKEISDAFKEVRESLPQNISDKMQMLHKRGFIAPADGMGRLRGWMITRSGTAHLEKLRDGIEEN